MLIMETDYCKISSHLRSCIVGFEGRSSIQVATTRVRFGLTTLSRHLAPISAFFILHRFLPQPRRAGQQVLVTVMTDPVKNGTDEERIKNRKRFELELEFVQALANPFYLHSLAQQGILYQPAFINYLKYLLYWKEKDYARFILWV